MIVSRQGLGCAVAAVAVVTCFSCGDDEDKALEFCLGDQQFIHFLVVGNQWTYRVTDYGPDHTLKTTRTTTTRIYGDTLINGEVWYKVNTDGNEDFAWTLRDDGFWVWYEYRYAGSDPPYRLAKFPATVGESWSIGTYTMTVEDSIASVQALGQVFTTHLYRLTDANGAFSSDSFFAPGLGQVRLVRMIPRHDGDITRIMDLTHFSSPDC